MMYPNPFDFAAGSQEQWVDYNAWTKFWLLCEQEWAEAEKKMLYYPGSPCDFCSECDCCNCENNPDPQEEPCDFGFSEECVEPQLRNTNCCFECWLYNEVDNEDRKSAKNLEEEAEVEA